MKHKIGDIIAVDDKDIIELSKTLSGVSFRVNELKLTEKEMTDRLFSIIKERYDLDDFELAYIHKAKKIVLIDAMKKNE